MRIALAQINSYLGDFLGNSEKMIQFANQAADQNCDLVVFPELSLLGYHPFDLLERSGIIDKQNEAIQKLVAQLPESIACLVGAITKNPGPGKPYFNSALLIAGGAVRRTFSKELLPVYDVFDDSRHITPGKMADNHFEWKGKQIQILICEDMWGWDSLHEKNPILDLRNPVDCIVNLSASPFTIEKRNQRLIHARKTVEHLRAPLVYVNMVGAQDELIYDGGSFALDRQGQVIAQSPYFSENLNVVDVATGKGLMAEPPGTSTLFLQQALVLGIQDFLKKTGFKQAHLGFSGGIDSAVVACLVADAIGAKNLTGIAMPTRFNHQDSFDFSKKLAENIGCAFFNLPIQKAFESVVETYDNTFGKKPFSVMHENLQARLRGMFMMAFSNEKNSMLMTTGNKSEFATGFATLYGDMCGGLAPIGDLLKAQVYELATYYCDTKKWIPKEIIDRPPSAELRENQKDSDSLPPYSELDPAVEKIVGKKQEAESKTERWLLNQLYKSEFKRWQTPPVLKISNHAFGQGRRMPIAHKVDV